jgi:hypothetical protein
VGDFNGDGKPDLVVASNMFNGQGNVSVLLGNGDGTFRSPVTYAADKGTNEVAVADLNGDGLADLVTANYAGNDVSVLLGDGDGTFRAAVNYGAGTNSYAVTVGDFNGDGTPDLASAGIRLTTSPATIVVDVQLNGDLPRAAFVTGAAPATFTTTSLNAPVRDQLRGFDAAGHLLYSFDPYFDVTQSELGGPLPLAVTLDVRVALADLTGDGVPDIITAPGPGGAVNGQEQPVRVFGGKTGWQISGPLGSALAYAPEWTGGVYVATGDITGDGTPDIVLGADAGGGPHVRVIDGKTGQEVQFAGHPELTNGFYAYDVGMSSGVRVAVADVNGDGQMDIVTAAGPGGGPHMRVFDGRDLHEIILNGSPGFQHGFYAFDPGYTGGVYIAARDLNGDGKADLIVGAGRDVPEVKVFSGADGSVLRDFPAYGSDVTAGVRVAAADANGDGKPDIITAPGGGGGPVKALDGESGSLLESFAAYEPGPNNTVFTGGLFAVAP